MFVNELIQFFNNDSKHYLRLIASYQLMTITICKRLTKKFVWLAGHDYCWRIFNLKLRYVIFQYLLLCMLLIQYLRRTQDVLSEKGDYAT